MKKILLLMSLITLFCLGWPMDSHANVKIMKFYRELNPDLKSDCTYCHIDKQPKKEEGKHELNAYGEKIQELLKTEKKEMTDEELKAVCAKIFKEIGRHDAFKAEEIKKK